ARRTRVGRERGGRRERLPLCAAPASAEVSRARSRAPGGPGVFPRRPPECSWRRRSNAPRLSPLVITSDGKVGPARARWWPVLRRSHSVDGDVAKPRRADEEPLRAELSSVSQLEQHARVLAGLHEVGPSGRQKDRLLPRLAAN